MTQRASVSGTAKIVIPYKVCQGEKDLEVSSNAWLELNELAYFSYCIVRDRFMVLSRMSGVQVHEFVLNNVVLILSY
jgi:hypothetical protein